MKKGTSGQSLEGSINPNQPLTNQGKKSEQTKTQQGV